jgi:hypothetical protein
VKETGATPMLSRTIDVDGLKVVVKAARLAEALRH